MTPDLITRLEAGSRELDREIWEALGNSFRKVTRLGLNGRTPGRWMPFDHATNRVRSATPRYTATEKARAKALKALRALTPTKEGSEDHGV